MGSLVFRIQGEGEVVKNQNWEGGGGSLVFSIGGTGGGKISSGPQLQHFFK